MAYGLTTSGFVPKTEAELLQSLLDGVEARCGVTLDRAPESSISRLLGAYARVLAEGWSAADEIWRAGDRSQAAGVPLDDLVSVTGLRRLPATRSVARVICVGRDGTELPAGRVIHSARGDRFASAEAAVLSPALWQGKINFFRPVKNTRYTLSIDGHTVQILAGAGDSAEALAARLAAGLTALHLPLTVAAERGACVSVLAHDLAARPVFTLTVEPPWTAELRLSAVTADTNYGVLVSASGPLLLGTINGTDPPLAGTILANLAGQLTGATSPLEAELSPDGLGLFLRHRQPGGAFTLSLNGPMTQRAATPAAASLATATTTLLPAAELRFDAEQTGPVPAAALALDRIATPVAGLERCFNPEAADEGRLLESDADLRLRQRRSLQVPGTAVRESMAARLRQAFPAARAVRVVENDADTPDADGRPPHCFEVLIDIVEDAALDEQIARVIEGCRPAGIQAAVGAALLNGDAARQPVVSTVSTIDFQGQTRSVVFTRPGILKIYLVVQLHRHPDRSMPADVEEQVRAMIVDHGRGLGVGQDVVPGRLLRAVHQVPGIGRAAFAWATTQPPTSITGAIPGVGWMNPIAVGAAYRAVIDPQDVIVQVLP